MSGAPAAWEPPEAWEAPEDDVIWRGALHPESDEPGWPEPEPPSEYHLLKDELEDDEET